MYFQGHFICAKSELFESINVVRRVSSTIYHCITSHNDNFLLGLTLAHCYYYFRL